MQMRRAPLAFESYTHLALISSWVALSAGLWFGIAKVVGIA